MAKTRMSFQRSDIHQMIQGFAKAEFSYTRSDCQGESRLGSLVRLEAGYA